MCALPVVPAVLTMAAASAAEVRSQDASVRWNDEAIEMETHAVTLRLVISGGALSRTAWVDRRSGRDLLSGGAIEDFALVINGALVSSAQPGWRIGAPACEKGAHGELQLAVTLIREGVQAVRHYRVFPGLSLLRGWLEISNAGTGQLTLNAPPIVSAAARGGPLDLKWMSGAELFGDSWKLRTEHLGDEERVFTAPRAGKVSIAGSLRNTGNAAPPGPGFRLGSMTYAPWLCLMSPESGQAAYVGFDCMAHWQARVVREPDGGAALDVRLTGFSKSLGQGDSVRTPYAFMGVFADDLDNMGDELLEWQYRYMWDYTREPWFPAVRMLGYWMKGTNWGSHGWLGGEPDMESAFRKVFRTADLMRCTGGDTYHRDWCGPRRAVWGASRGRQQQRLRVSVVVALGSSAPARRQRFGHGPDHVQRRMAERGGRFPRPRRDSVTRRHGWRELHGSLRGASRRVALPLGSRRRSGACER